MSLLLGVCDLVVHIGYYCRLLWQQQPRDTLNGIWNRLILNNLYNMANYHVTSFTK
jgi:hypothetical protein